MFVVCEIEAHADSYEGKDEEEQGTAAALSAAEKPCQRLVVLHCHDRFKNLVDKDAADKDAAEK